MAEHAQRNEVEERLDGWFGADHPRRYASSDDPTTDPNELRAEQFREADEMAAGPGVPVMTGPMAKGMALGTLVGGALGALVLAPFALLPILFSSVAVRLIVFVGVGAFGGAVAGASYFGGRVPELSGESLDADNRPSAGSSLRDPDTDDRGR
ncbi:MAG: hypothetical protein OSA99_16145 [Acidimicrobiales bacterium]|nr:hypothetical protein [Acidimicrobiales bacterium]